MKIIIISLALILVLNSCGNVSQEEEKALIISSNQGEKKQDKKEKQEKIEEKNILDKKQKEIYNYLVENKDTSEFTEKLKSINREKRKKICEKIVEEYYVSDPKFAFSGANCLLHNGYPEKAIPLFAEYIFGENNKKYFNGRIGYGWLHAGDWYEVGGEVLGNMTKNRELYEWITDEINNEIYKNSSKYLKINPDVIGIILKSKNRYLAENIGKKISEKKKEINSCYNQIINIDGFQCELNISEKYAECRKEIQGKNIDNVSEKCEKVFIENKPKFKNCKIKELKGSKIKIDCNENGIIKNIIDEKIIK